MDVQNKMDNVCTGVIEAEKQRLRDLRERLVTAAVLWAQRGNVSGNIIVATAQVFFEYVENSKEGNE